MAEDPSSGSRSLARQEAVDDARLELIGYAGDLARSHAVSVVEAAWRDDRLLLEMHLSQLRLAVIEACQVFKDLGK